MKGFYLTLKSIFRWPLYPMLPVKVLGKENLPKNQRVVTICNHLNAIDVVLLILYLPGFRRVLGKKELGSKKIPHAFLKAAGVIFIDRGTTDLNAIREVLDTLKKDVGVALFPEGTRNKVSTEVQDIKAGATMFAIKGKAEILPVSIHHKQRFFHKNYMYIGKTIYLNDIFGDRLDNGKMEAATKLVEQLMRDNKAELDRIVEGKLWKERKKEIKNKKKQLKIYKKQQKKGIRAAAKAF